MSQTAALMQQFTEAPLNPALWLQMARHTAEHGDVRRAKEIYKALGMAAPYHTEAWYELGLCYERLGDWPRAYRSFKLACEVSERRQGHGIAQASLGSTCYRLGLPHNGKRHYDAALKHADDRPYARFARSLIKLARGEWAEGWADYEARWEVPQLADAVKLHGIDPANLPPRWDGTHRNGWLLVTPEQGMGDCIWAERYIPSDADLPVAILSPASLVSFYRDHCGWEYVATSLADLPPCDWHAPMMSLPHLTSRTDPIPMGDERNHPTKGTGRIGYCWHGESSMGNDKDRSCPFPFADALTAAGFTPVSLQHGEPTHFRDYGETADLMATCDAVLTVDTSVAHLAGTLGIPTVWFAQTVPDWRTPGTGSTTPWYPSAHVIRRQDASVASWHDALGRAIRHLKATA